MDVMFGFRAQELFWAQITSLLFVLLTMLVLQMFANHRGTDVEWYREIEHQYSKKSAFLFALGFWVSCWRRNVIYIQPGCPAALAVSSARTSFLQQRRVAYRQTDFYRLSVSFFFRLFSSSSLLPSYPSIIRCNYILISHLNISKYDVWTSNCLGCDNETHLNMECCPKSPPICSIDHMQLVTKSTQQAMSQPLVSNQGLNVPCFNSANVNETVVFIIESFVFDISAQGCFQKTVKVWQSGAAFVPSKKWCGEFTCIGRCGHLKVQKWRAANMNWIATDFRHTLALNSITQAS